MKTIFRIAAIAVIAMGLTVACKSKTAEPVEDTTAIETIVDDTTDTIEEMAEEIAENIEEPVKAVKNEVKKETTKKVDETKSNVTVENANTNMKAGKKKNPTTTEVTTKSTEASQITVENANTSMKAGKKKKANN